MKRSAFFPLACLTWGLLIFHPGCGTDVGNAGKPIVNEESSDLAAVAGMQHDEVINSVNDDGSSDTVAALALYQPGLQPRLAANSTSCIENADGSATVQISKSLALESEFGRSTRRKMQADTLEASRDITYSVPAILGAVTCHNNKPNLSLAQLAELKAQTKLSRSRKRSVTLKADGSVISQSELSAKGDSSVQYATSGTLLDGLTVRRTTSLNSTVSLLRQNEDEALTRTVQTLEAEPIVLEKTRTRGAGVTRVEIVSGAVASTHNESRKVVVRYRNLVLSLGSSCHPTSGSIEGEIFASSTATEAESTFALVFDSDGATLVRDDGTEEDVELESCQI